MHGEEVSYENVGLTFYLEQDPLFSDASADLYALRQVSPASLSEVECFLRGCPVGSCRWSSIAGCGEVRMAESRLIISELEERDLPLLFELWHIPEVMKYADELPRLRGWSKSDDIERVWAKYRGRRTALGRGYTQVILRLVEGRLIGESFFAPVPEDFTLGKWKKPEEVRCLIGDIKLRPEYWGQGLGTEGMRGVVEWLFGNTDCALLVVPPHGSNPAAVRVYEKAGFAHIEETRSWRGHRIMELWRERFEAIYGQ
jgi:RimJ/RimL family protein N-acetyltransferase